MNRAEIVSKIDDLLDNHCTGCEAKADITRQHGHDSAESVNNCRNICQVGKDLGALGKQLSSIARPRKKIEEDEEDMGTIIPEVAKGKNKFTLTAEQYLEERKSGKGIAVIAKENGVSDPTVRSYVKQWEAEGKIPTAKVPDAVSAETLKASVVALQVDLKPYQEEIERQRLEIESLNLLYANESERADQLQRELEFLHAHLELQDSESDESPVEPNSLDIIAETIADLEKAQRIIKRLTSPE